LKRIDDKLVIVGESDLVTDGEVGFVLDLGKELKPSRLGKAKISKREREEQSLGRLIIYSLSGLLIFGMIALYWNRKRTKQSLEPDASEFTKEELAGRDFEDYVVNRFNVEGPDGWKYFKLLDWRGDKAVNGIYPVSNLYPDLCYEFRAGSVVRKFAIECKYRSRLMGSVFELKPKQLENYKEYQAREKLPVYIVLGLGGVPAYPKDLFVIPLSEFSKTNSIRASQLRYFYNDPGEKFFYDTYYNALKIQIK
jgi:hypothetical protein